MKVMVVSIVVLVITAGTCAVLASMGGVTTGREAIAMVLVGVVGIAAQLATVWDEMRRK